MERAPGSKGAFLQENVLGNAGSRAKSIIEVPIKNALP